MKIRILNTGGYPTKRNIKFPIVVEGSVRANRLTASVKVADLVRVGFSRDEDKLQLDQWLFVVGTDCELVDGADL